MTKYKFDPNIHARLVEEIYRISDTNADLSRRLGSTADVVKYWVNTPALPGTYYLAQLHKQGADIMYILTGEVTKP